MPFQDALCRVADPQASCAFIPMVFLPSFVLLAFPLTLLPPAAAFILWSGISLILVFLALRPFLRSFPEPERWQILALMLLSYPTFTNLFWGQVNAWLLLGLACFQAHQETGEDLRSGLWLGWLLLKPQMLILLLPGLALAGQWRTLAGFGISAGLIFLVSLILGGFQGLEGWWGWIRGFSSPSPAVAPAVVGAETMMNWRAIGVWLQGTMLAPLLWDRDRPRYGPYRFPGPHRLAAGQKAGEERSARLLVEHPLCYFRRLMACSSPHRHEPDAFPPERPAGGGPSPPASAALEPPSGEPAFPGYPPGCAPGPVARGRGGQLPGRADIYDPSSRPVWMGNSTVPFRWETSMKTSIPWGRWAFLFLLCLIIGWEAILAGYKLSEFPYHAVDFFQHDFLARFLQRGGSFTDPSWPAQIGSTLGLRLPPSLERTAPLLLYQPIVLPLFLVLALFPMHVAYAIWLAISLMLIGWTGWRIARTLGVSPAPVLFALGMWPAVWHVLLLGNMDIFAWALMNAGWLSFLQGRPRWGGFWIGWAAALKGFPLFAVVPWLRNSGRSVVEGFIAGILTSVLWGTLWVGPEGWAFLLSHLPDYGRALEMFMPGNNSLLAWLWALGGSPVPHEKGILLHGLLYPGIVIPIRPLYILGALLLLLTAWILTRHSSPQFLLVQSGFWLSVGLLVWPVSWINYHIYMFLPVIYLIRLRKFVSIKTKILLMLSITFLTVSISYGVLVTGTAPYMSLPLLMFPIRLVLFIMFSISYFDIKYRRIDGSQK